MERVKILYTLLFSFFHTRVFLFLDTDSLGFCMSKDSLEECVLPEKHHSFFQNYNIFFQCKACVKCHSEWVNVKTEGGHWEQSACCKEAKNYLLRTPPPDENRS